VKESKFLTVAVRVTGFAGQVLLLQQMNRHGSGTVNKAFNFFNLAPKVLQMFRRLTVNVLFCSLPPCLSVQSINVKLWNNKTISGTIHKLLNKNW